MRNGMMDADIVGTDRTTSTGDVSNKIGTYLNALAAKNNGIPIYVALPSSSFDWDMRVLSLEKVGPAGKDGGCGFAEGWQVGVAIAAEGLGVNSHGEEILF